MSNTVPGTHGCSTNGMNVRTRKTSSGVGLLCRRLKGTVRVSDLVATQTGSPEKVISKLMAKVKRDHT